MSLLIYKKLENVSFIFKLPSYLIFRERTKRGETTMALKNVLSLLVLLTVLGVSVALPNPLLNLKCYQSTCPGAEQIVDRVTRQYVNVKPSLAASLLRMHFHDCFVRGCDGSILLKSAKNDAERNSIPNLTLRGFEVIDAVKTALEKKCPGVVSCADIVALVARDAVNAINGPWWPVPLGRRDGRISRISEVNLPSPFSNVATLKKNFADKGLNVKDLVVLSGAHTIGISSCAIIHSRIYNFTGKGDFDPSMDLSYVRALKKRCSPTDFKTVLEMDPGSVKTFDTHYYNIVDKKKGLFTSDATLLDDVQTKAYIEAQVLTNGLTFASDFANSMVKLGAVQVLTGKNGEIRKKCGFIN